MTTRRTLLALMVLLAGLGSGCSDDDNDNDGSGGTIDLVVENPDRCEPLDGKHCLLPFPSDTFTVEDSATDTGKRINLVRDSMPVNQDGIRVDPTEWNRNDGFSPGQQIATYIEGIDLAGSGIPGADDIGASLATDAGIVLLDTNSQTLLPYWAELDATAITDADRVVLIRPAIHLAEGHRFVIALRNLKDTSGADIPAGDVFRAYRDRLRSNVPEVEARRERFEQVFDDLEAVGVDRDDLFLAWDFTVASERSLSERVLHMRDQAFAQLGSAAPSFNVASVEENVDDRIARRVIGTFAGPLYLTGGGVPGTRMSFGSDGKPALTGTYNADFTCIVPHAAFAADGSAVPARPGVYGHGLLGSDDEVSAGNVRAMANEHNFVFCATKWIGMSEQDIGNAVTILGDLSHFPTLADRTQQGLLNTLFLGRLLLHPQGFASHSAFQAAGGASVIDHSELFYDGNSQGGIMGGAATAIATDWTRAVLGVTAMNYSILLQRSIDWATYEAIYNPSYPNSIDRQLGLMLIQMLWDRGETSGYVHHLTDDPLPNTPAHEVLMHIAFGDHQVSPAVANIQARTIGARLHTPATTPGRVPEVEPYWGIEPIAQYPYDGSAIIIWDSGAAVPPLVNLPPFEGEDPHGDPRNDPDARVQKSEFLRTGGVVVDVCNGAPCIADRQ